MTNTDRTFHDTYYVVAHYHYILSLVVVFVLFAFAWRTILRYSRHFTRSHAFVAALAFATGILLSLAPVLTILLADPVHTDFTLFNTANTVAVVGSLIQMVTLATSAGILITTLITARKRR